MYRVVGYVTGEATTTQFVFRRELMPEAQRLTEELAQTGCWIAKASCDVHAAVKNQIRRSPCAV